MNCPFCKGIGFVAGGDTCPHCVDEGLNPIGLGPLEFVQLAENDKQSEKERTVNTAQKLIKLQKQFLRYKKNTCLISVNDYGVHIDYERMTEIAPLAEWELNNERTSEMYPFEHKITIEGVLFFAETENRIELSQEEE
jgi:hypothetical protein